MGENLAAIIAAEYLETNADLLVTTWVEWVQERVQTTTVKALPERALRNYIPPVLRSLAKYLRNPIESARQELLSQLRLHGQVRRDQGYALEEVLAEFDGLADVVMRGVSQAIETKVGDVTPHEVLEAANRLAMGLRSVSYIAMGTFIRADRDREQMMAASLEEFARAISHELRNPLNTLSLNLQALQEEVGDHAELLDYIESMEAAVNRSTYLLDTIRILTVAEGARAGQRLVTLEEAINRIQREFSEEFLHSGVELRIESPLPGVSIEATLLYLVLVNLVGNAIKYSDRDKGERWIALSAVLIEEKNDSGFCEIRIEDNGIGIAEEYLSRVLQKGFRAHPEHAEGTGLGLFLVQQALNARGASMSIDSQAGQGTLVAVRLRCLNPESASLSADQFRVESLMGESIWNELSASPRLPSLNADDEAEGDSEGDMNIAHGEE